MLKLTPLVLVFSFMAFAQSADNFEKRKSEALSNIDKRIAQLNEHRSCVDAAKDKDALKACHDKMREAHMGHKMERIEKRKERMDKRMERMKERRKGE